MSSILPAVASLLDEAVVLYADSPEAERLRMARARLDEPLRVALAGKIKAGKSTLLNALVGEILAPTDAGERTKIVTWYVESHTPRVTVEPREGPPLRAPFTRDEGAIDVQLDELSSDDVARLVIEWPSSALRGTTLIDTPGIDSLSASVSGQTYAFLTPDDDEDTPADAVLYLMRHLHASDVRFLEAFHDEEVSRATPINAIGVLSRADEVGAGRPDAMESAAKIAARYRTDPQVRRLCQTVVPVAGLLAESGSTLTQDEFRAFAALAAAPADELDRLLLTADRFAELETDIPLDSVARDVFLSRFGVFGIRLGTKLVREGAVPDAGGLADELVRRSGLTELRRVLGSQFTDRRDILKARTGLSALDRVLRASPVDGSERLAGELERIEASAHEFAELRLLNALRAGAVELPDPDAAERLLGVAGTDPRSRLGLPVDAPDEAVRQSASDTLSGWRRIAEHPLSEKPTVDAADVLARTCEGMIAPLG